MRLLKLPVSTGRMKITAAVCILFLLGIPVAEAAPKAHVVALGKWSTVKWLVGVDETTIVELKIRPLLVDGRIKEFLVGAIHDVTDRTFVGQRVYRLNDSLPQENGAHWRWERGGWLLMDRVTGKVQAIALAGFDPYQSSVTWFRDYAAYCGFSEDGSKVFATVVQLARRKPLLKKSVDNPAASEMPESACVAPVWQKAPSRVTFQPKDGPKFVYSIRSRALDLVAEDGDGEE